MGALEFERSGELVDLGTYRQKSLLALMLLHRNQVVSTDRILDELWGDSGAGKRNALWVHVSNLRSALEPERSNRSEGSILLTRAPGYLLNVDSEAVDSAVFERLVSEARGLLSFDPSAAALVFAEALALWRGRVLQEFTYESFAQAEIHRLELLRLDAVEGRVEADLARGLSHQLVGELQGLVRENPLREHLTYLLMTSLYRSGRQAEALRAYNQLRSRLGSELGIEPSGPVRDLEEQIVLGDPRLEVATKTWAPEGRDPGLAVRGYELRAQVGNAGYGVIYRAYQPAMGREVAVKVIRPELANDPGFIRKFETEASLVAGFESANVVPLYDFWREPDGAYVVEKLISGGTLSRLVSNGPLASDRVAVIVDQVARPLVEAHSLGIVHGSVSLETVLLDLEGNAHLSGFATTSDESARPEGDIEGLATCAAQLLAGSEGTIPQLVPRLDPRLGDVLRAASDPPAFVSVGEFVSAFQSAAGVVGDPPDRWFDGANPYKGLEPFDETDTAHFFGRERLVERMLVRLAEGGPGGRFLAVVGPSGSGKSSVVNAGLIPALRAGGVPGSDSWFIATMTPGSHPFEALEQALNKVGVDVPSILLEQLMASRDGLRLAVDRVLPDEDSPLVLVVDQFEELYTMTDDDEREAFTLALVEAITHHKSRLRVVITLRADFYDQPLTSRELGELLRGHTELVTPMTPSELQLAINSPAETAGVVVQPALLAALTDDVVSDSGALPMLQYTLTELFERRQATTMTATSYASMGGLTGAVVGRAEDLYGALTPGARSTVRHVFLRLISINETGEATRRRVLLSELQGLAARDGDIDEMIRAFARHRLLSFDRDPASRGPTVEIAHESLIVAWTRLNSWIDEARDDLRAQRRLSTAAAEWLGQGENPDFLLTGDSLARYQSWRVDPPVRLTSDERRYLDVAFEQQQVRDLAAADQLLQKSRLQRRTRALVGLGVTSVVVIALALIAFDQRETARRLASELAATDRARQLVAESGLAVNDDPDLAILLAIEAMRATGDTGEALPEAADALHWALQEANVAFPPDDEDIPVAVRLRGDGYRGVFALSPATLADLGQQAVGHGFTTTECDRFFPDGQCPDPIRPISPEMSIAGGFEQYTGVVTEGPILDGTRVVVTGAWGSQDAMADWEPIEESLGIDIIYRTHRFDQGLNDTALDEDSTDIPLISAPGALADIASQRPLADIGAIVGERYLRDSFGDYLTELGSVEGRSYGLPVRVGAGSLIWYNPEAFAAAGYSVPSSWNELIALSDRMVEDGNHPWCLGIFAFGDTGWPATNWLESTLIGSEGPEFYDRWATHQVPANHPAVVAALEKVGQLAHTPGYRTPRRIEETGWDEALYLASQDPPQCWLAPFPDFAPVGFDATSGTSMAPMPFPAVDPTFASAMFGGADFALAVVDRPEVREVLRAMAAPEWGTNWAGAGGFIAPHRDFDLEAYTDPVWHAMASSVDRAVEADMWRYDASDQMPFEIGFGPLLTSVTDYVKDSEMSAEMALFQVEQAWQAYEAETAE